MIKKSGFLVIAVLLAISLAPSPAQSSSEEDAVRAAVLEYVEGVSLAQRLNNGPLPVDEALEFCEQIAAGLESAHDKGIVHRDLRASSAAYTPT